MLTQRALEIAMSNRIDTAMCKSFEKGQAAWRDGKDIDNDNPYPHSAPYHDYWRQGWEQEDEILHK